MHQFEVTPVNWIEGSNRTADVESIPYFAPPLLGSGGSNCQVDRGAFARLQHDRLPAVDRVGDRGPRRGNRCEVPLNMNLRLDLPARDEGRSDRHLQAITAVGLRPLPPFPEWGPERDGPRSPPSPHRRGAAG